MSLPSIDWTTWEPKTPATLMFIVRDGRILLIEKKRGHGAGKINGPGGKIDPGETSLEAAIRETQEELGITPLSPRKLGELWFVMSDVPDILCHVYRADAFEGEPVETAEAVPVWASLDDIPYDRMWVDDVMWLPLLIDDVAFRGRFVFEEEAMLFHQIETGLVWEN
jgi:8-oxo-dGTP diphosphatase